MDVSPKSLTPRLAQIVTPNVLSWVAIVLAIALRIVQYLYNRSLWADESVLALNIRDRSYLELLQQLDYDQAAPIGFLWVEKLAIQIFGDNEYALRLFPFCCGILSIFLFYHLAKIVLKNYAIPIAVGFFAVLEYLLYYPAEVKQYSSDVAVALGLAWLTLAMLQRELSTRAIAGYAVIGAVLMWFSHPAVLTGGGFAAYALINASLTGKKAKIPAILVIFAVWGLSFLGFYFISLLPLSNNQTLADSWKKAFPPSWTDFAWLEDKWSDFFRNPLGFPRHLVSIAMGTWFVGVIALGIRRRMMLAFVAAPILATLLAAYLHQYPFRSRLLLFLTPFFILLIAEGIHFIGRKTRSKLWGIPGIVLFIWLFFDPFSEAVSHFANPIVREEIRPVIAYVRENQQPGDILYIFQRGEYQFQYYAEQFGYQPGEYIVGVDDLDDGKAVSPQEWQRYQADLNQLQGNDRVWLLFSHIDSVDEERERVLAYLDSLGTQLERYDRPGAFVLLYDMSTPQ